MRNVFAALVAIVCWTGLAIQFSTVYGHEHHIMRTAWILGRFFTITTNLLVALTMTWAAIGRRVSPFVLGGATLSIVVVGIVFAVLLRGMHPVEAEAFLANIILHDVAPVLMGLWWLLFAPRSRLKWNAPSLWVIYPVAYCAFVLFRSRLDGRYPYPFMDVSRIGRTQVALNLGGIAFGFLLCGFMLVWIDSWRPLGSKRANG